MTMQHLEKLKFKRLTINNIGKDWKQLVYIYFWWECKIPFGKEVCSL